MKAILFGHLHKTQQEMNNKKYKKIKNSREDFFYRIRELRTPHETSFWTFMVISMLTVSANCHIIQQKINLLSIHVCFLVFFFIKWYIEFELNETQKSACVYDELPYISSSGLQEKKFKFLIFISIFLSARCHLPYIYR